MKKLILALLALACLGTAFAAQAPVATIEMMNGGTLQNATR